MNEGQLIGTIIGVSNMILGISLAVFQKPIGSNMATLGKKFHADKFFGAKLYDERNSRRFVLVVGIALVLWGVIAFFLLPAMIGEANSGTGI